MHREGFQHLTKTVHCSKPNENLLSGEFYVLQVSKENLQLFPVGRKSPCCALLKNLGSEQTWVVLCTAGSDCCWCHRCSPSCIRCYIWKNHWGKFFLVFLFLVGFFLGFFCFVLGMFFWFCFPCGFCLFRVFWDFLVVCFVWGFYLQLEVAVLSFSHAQPLSSFHVSLSGINLYKYIHGRMLKGLSRSRVW